MLYLFIFNSIKHCSKGSILRLSILQIYYTHNLSAAARECEYTWRAAISTFLPLCMLIHSSASHTYVCIYAIWICICVY